MARIELNTRPQLSQNIVLLRRARQWTQEQLAHRVGVHVNIIKRIESGKGEGEPATRQAIADALGVSLADLYKDAAKAKRPDLAAHLLEVAGILESIALASPARRLSALFLISQNEAYIAELLALDGGSFAPIAQSLRKLA